MREILTQKEKKEERELDGEERLPWSIREERKRVKRRQGKVRERLTRKERKN